MSSILTIFTKWQYSSIWLERISHKDEVTCSIQVIATNGPLTERLCVRLQPELGRLDSCAVLQCDSRIMVIMLVFQTKDMSSILMNRSNAGLV